MPGFPTVNDLGEYTKVTPAMALRTATNRLIAELGWDPRQSTRTLRVAGQRTVLLPALHVTSVAAEGATPGSWTEAGVVRFAAPYVGQITYTAGWVDADLPEVLSDVILEWAAGWVDNPRGLYSWTTGSEAETYARTSGAGGDPRLDPYRVRVVLA